MINFESEAALARQATSTLIQPPTGEVVEIEKLFNPETGFVETKVLVSDEYATAEYADERDAVNNYVAWLKDYFNTHPDAEPGNNPVTHDLFDPQRSPAMVSWKKEIPTARALFPLQNPEIDILPDGTPMDAWARAHFRHSADGIGMRSREKVSTWLLSSQFQTPRDGAINIASLACGGGEPTTKAANIMRSYGNKVHMTMIDIDEEALNFAGRLIESYGFSKDEYSLLDRNLLRTKKLIEEFGTESFDAVDMLGIFEYFKSSTAKRILKDAYTLLRPGGVLVFANMLDSHPQLEVTQQVIGWDMIHPRSADKVCGLIKETGINNAEIIFPDDGVYLIAALRKPS